MNPKITEFQCIMPMENIPLVLAHGILSYERAAKLEHRSVAMQQVQERRDQKHVPGGLKLHQYANLYFHARNPMLFKRKDEADTLCVLRVSVDVLKIENVVITDSNASSDYVRFLHPLQMGFLNLDAIYAMDWRHQGNQIAYWQHRSQKCAEVLVPYQVEPAHLVGAYVVDNAAALHLQAQGFKLPIEINPVFFFR